MSKKKEITLIGDIHSDNSHYYDIIRLWSLKLIFNIFTITNFNKQKNIKTEYEFNDLLCQFALNTCCIESILYYIQNKITLK